MLLQQHMHLATQWYEYFKHYNDECLLEMYCGRCNDEQILLNELMFLNSDCDVSESQ